MHDFRVWAPEAARVEVVVGPAGGDRTLTMDPAGGGWWAATIDAAGPGTDYRFVLDGGPPRPDPRSQWQPQGVDGPSRVVDHGEFEWTDRHWRGAPLESLVVYELHVGTFSPEGTFDGAVARLDHLTDLGVGAIELMPVAEFPGRRGWGYDGVDLWAPHSAYGGPDGLKRLVDACHHRGLVVILDVVYNHLGPYGNHLAAFGPYFTDRHTTPWGTAVNFDGPESDEVRAFVVDNAAMWLRDYHLDGLRLDAVHAIHDESATHILAELGGAVADLRAELGRSLFVIAESDLNDPRVFEPRQAGGHGLDSQWSDDFHHALHAALTDESDGWYADFGPLALVAKALEHGFVQDGGHSSFRRRRHGRPVPPGTRGTRLVGYLQNHDQVGNRAKGERSSHLVGTARLELAAALVLTAPFVPMLFQGEEWGASTPFRYFTDHQDPALAAAVSEGRRREFAAFGWAPAEVPDPQDPATFACSRLAWDEVVEEPHAGLLEWHRALIRLRAETSGLAGGSRFEDVRVDYDEEAGWLVMRRGGVVVAANFGLRTASVAIEVDGEVLLASPGSSLEDGTAQLPPDGVLIAR